MGVNLACPAEVGAAPLDAGDVVGEYAPGRVAGDAVGVNLAGDAIGVYVAGEEPGANTIPLPDVVEEGAVGALTADPFSFPEYGLGGGGLGVAGGRGLTGGCGGRGLGGATGDRSLSAAAAEEAAAEAPPSPSPGVALFLS